MEGTGRGGVCRSLRCFFFKKILTPPPLFPDPHPLLSNNPTPTQIHTQAMHGWDHAVMYDMYTWDSLREVAASHDMDLGDVLQVCISGVVYIWMD